MTKSLLLATRRSSGYPPLPVEEQSGHQVLAAAIGVTEARDCGGRARLL